MAVGPDRDADLAAAAFLDAGEFNAQLSGLERRRGAAAIDRSSEADDAREPAEGALREVECGVLVPTRRRELGAGNQHGAAGKHDLH